MRMCVRVCVIVVTAAILYTSEQETVIISRSSRDGFSSARLYMFLCTHRGDISRRHITGRF